MNKVLVTGANGFLGKRFTQLYPDCETVSLRETPPGQLDLTGVGRIVHFAGIAHQSVKDPKLYFSINRDLTLELARAARDSGVRYFLFISTIKVYGAGAANGQIDRTTPCSPIEPYGQSKWEAEQQLISLTSADFKVAIVRPPLVSGPGAKGNLDKLMRMVQRKVPLPLGGINNRRSLIYVDNLCRFLEAMLNEEISGTFVPVDTPAVSTSQLVSLLQETIHPSGGLFSLPVPLRALLGRFMKGTYERLFGDMAVDTAGFRVPSGYQQEVTMEEGLKRMAEAFNQTTGLR